MLKLHVLLITICAHLSYSQQCSSPSFDKTIVTVEAGTNTQVLIIDCISPETLKYEGELTKLSVSDQNIPDLNRGAVRGIQDSFVIEFKHNNIEIIREEAFLDLPNVTLIDLSENKIHWIGENAFFNLPSLNKVNLRSNSVTILSRAFNGLPKLTEVDISDNNLESFDQGWFYRTPALWWLWFRDNRLRKIPKAAFINLPNIRQLHFENNQIDEIDPDAFKGLRNLERIYFASNKLKSFEINFSTPSKLMYMGIQFNNITYLSDRMLEIIKPNLLKFWITSNPWQCGCFDKLIDWGIKNNIQIAFMCVQLESVCVYPKTRTMECVERTDDDFYSDYSNHFGSEWSCTPGSDY